MTAEPEDADRIDEIFNTPDLAEALGSDRFRQFLDHLPVAIAVSELPGDQIAYVNIEFGRLTTLPINVIEGKSWQDLLGPTSAEDSKSLDELLFPNDDQEGPCKLQLHGT